MVGADDGLIASALLAKLASGTQSTEETERATDYLLARYTQPKPSEMTGLDLAKFFELPIQENGQPNWSDFINACMSVQFNEKVIALPDDERVQIIQLAAACLGKAGFA